jgi:hypothetical protein
VVLIGDSRSSSGVQGQQSSFSSSSCCVVVIGGFLSSPFRIALRFANEHASMFVDSLSHNLVGGSLFFCVRVSEKKRTN